MKKAIGIGLGVAGVFVLVTAVRKHMASRSSTTTPASPGTSSQNKGTGPALPDDFKIDGLDLGGALRLKGGKQANDGTSRNSTLSDSAQAMLERARELARGVAG